MNLNEVFFTGFEKILKISKHLESSFVDNGIHFSDINEELDEQLLELYHTHIDNNHDFLWNDFILEASLNDVTKSS